MAFDREPDEEVEALASAFEGAPPEAILEAALRAYPGEIAVVSSFGAESAVLLHMLAGVDPGAPVLFLDTGQLFGQTLDYRRRLASELGLTDVRDLRPAFADLAIEDPRADLFRRDADACCRIRKVRPLDRGLRGFRAWVTGRKRFQSIGRSNLRVAERGADGRIKINPLVALGPDALAAYVRRHSLPEHPLLAHGYPSIGCWPCTKPVEAGADARSGRWSGLEKNECGIHTERGEPGDVSNVGGDI